MAGESATKDKVEVQQPTTKAVSEQFIGIVLREFGNATGAAPSLTPYQKRLAQHLFIKIDTDLKNLEIKRAESKPNSTPMLWSNINMQKLALDAMHRVELGLDGLIPGHIYPIPYFNSRLKKYDLDLRIGYVGKDYYRRQMALDPPEDIIYELVYTNDNFKPIKKSLTNAIESYEFEITKPFDRGEIVGGFAYLVYKQPERNKLIMVTDDDFKKSMSKAMSKDFWTGYPEQMKYKTLVIRATNKLQMDPEKVNEAYLAAEAEDLNDAQAVEAAIDVSANKGKVLSIASETEQIPEETQQTQPNEQGNTSTEEKPEEVKEVKRGPSF